MPKGNNVAIIGAGGVGFDVATFLAHDNAYNIDSFLSSWQVDKSFTVPGGLLTEKGNHKIHRNIYLLQRSPGKQGKSLGKTTGWIHKKELQKRGVQSISGVAYEKIDDDGLHLKRENGEHEC
ncbi:MAG: NADPH-dependent 2,4-dienoyl-CoA reductase, partial [Bacteroidota bacterium]